MLEIEPMNSVFEDWALFLVLSLCGQECKDQLLYGGDELVRLVGNAATDALGWTKLGQRDGDHTSDTQDQGWTA